MLMKYVPKDYQVQSDIVDAIWLTLHIGVVCRTPNYCYYGNKSINKYFTLNCPKINSIHKFNTGIYKSACDGKEEKKTKSFFQQLPFEYGTRSSSELC